MADNGEQNLEQTPAGEDPSAVLESDLNRLQEERDALFQQLARVTADFRNAQKRLESDKLQAIQYANANLVKSLLPVIDSFERGLETKPAHPEAEAVLKGMQMVHDQLLRTLAAHNVQPIEPQPGTPFDPTRHEALTQQPSDQYAEPTVLQLYQRGYEMMGRVLRPAQVVVSRPRTE